MRAAAQTRSFRSEAREYEEAVASRTVPVWKPLLIVGLLAVCALAFVHLRSSTENLHAEIADLREKCAAGHKEIGNLQVQFEQYTSPQHILNGIARFGLALGLPQPGQVRRISLDDKPSEAMRPAHSSVETAYRLQNFR